MTAPQLSAALLARDHLEQTAAIPNLPPAVADAVGECLLKTIGALAKHYDERAQAAKLANYRPVRPGKVPG